MDPSSRTAAPRIAVVTAMVGGKDRLLDPAFVAPGVDYLAFTDAPVDSGVWRRREIPRWSDDPRFAARRDAKLPKILASLVLPEYDFSIWQDANILLRADPREIVARSLGDGDACLAAFRHASRDCVYEEAKIVLGVRLDHADRVRAQMRHYRTCGFPPNGGLVSCRFLVRRHRPETVAMDLAWWEQICRFSSRDQLSLPYVLHRLRTPVRWITGGNAWTNDLYDLRSHEFEDARVPAWRRIARSLLGRRPAKGR